MEERIYKYNKVEEMDKMIINSTKTFHPYKELVQLIKKAEKEIPNLIEILREVFPEISEKHLTLWKDYWTTIPFPVILKICTLFSDFTIVKKYLSSFKLIEEKVRNEKILIKVIPKDQNQEKRDNFFLLKSFGIVKNLDLPTLFILKNYRVKGEKTKELVKDIIPIFGREKELGYFLGISEKIVSKWKIGNCNMLLGSYLLLCLLTNNSKKEVWKDIEIVHPAFSHALDKSIIRSILDEKFQIKINEIKVPSSLKKKLDNFELIPIRVEISKKLMRKLVEKALAKFGTAKLLGYFLNRSESTILHWKSRYRADFETILKLCKISDINPTKLIKKERRKFYTLKGDFTKFNFFAKINLKNFEKTLAISESKEIKELLSLANDEKVKKEIEILLKQNKRIPLVTAKKVFNNSEEKYKKFLLGKTIAPKYRNPLYHKIIIPNLIEDETLLYLAGIIISDGSLRAPYISIISKDTNFLESILRPKLNRFWDIDFQLKPNAKVYKLIGCSKALCYFFSLFWDIPIGYKCSKVAVPRIISQNNALPFLAGLFDGDGYFDKESGIEFSTLSLKLIVSLHLLLDNIGIKNTRIEVEENVKKYKTRYKFTLKLGRENTKKLLPLILPYSYKLKGLNFGEIRWV